MATESKKLFSISRKPLANFSVVSKVGTRQFIGMWEKNIKTSRQVIKKALGFYFYLFLP